MFKGILFLVFSAFLCFYALSEETIRVGTWDYPPNLIIKKEKGEVKLEGAIVDVWLKYIAPRAKVKIEWVGPLPFPRAMEMLEAGELDALQHLSPTEERKKKFIFSQSPIMWGRQGLIVKKSEKLKKVSSLKDLEGKKIGMVAKGYLAPFFLENKDKINFELISTDDFARINIKKLMNDRIWAIYFTFPDVILYHASQMGYLNEIKILPFPGSDKNEVTYGAFSRKLNPELTKRLDNAITEASKIYDYEKMLRAYFHK